MGSARHQAETGVTAEELVSPQARQSDDQACVMRSLGDDPAVYSVGRGLVHGGHDVWEIGLHLGTGHRNVFVSRTEVLRDARGGVPLVLTGSRERHRQCPQLPLGRRNARHCGGIHAARQEHAHGAVGDQVS